MENIDYKARDRQAILDYLAGKGEVEVAKIITDSGANKLRVYPIIFELSMEGVVKITHQTELGTPEKVVMSEKAESGGQELLYTLLCA